MKRCEKLCCDFEGGRIVQISAQYSSDALEKVAEFLHRKYGEEDLFNGSRALFLWIFKQRVKGILLVETIIKARRISVPPEPDPRGNSKAESKQSEQEVPCRIGVNKLWIHPNFQSKKVDLMLLQEMTEILHVEEDSVAFSDTFFGQDHKSVLRFSK